MKIPSVKMVGGRGGGNEYFLELHNSLKYSADSPGNNANQYPTDLCHYLCIFLLTMAHRVLYR